jgi:hypothetical protein
MPVTPVAHFYDELADDYHLIYTPRCRQVLHREHPDAALASPR